jgi:hypothetical protein
MRSSVLPFAVCLFWPAPESSQTAAPSTEEFVTKIGISDMMEFRQPRSRSPKSLMAMSKPFAERKK